MTHTLEPFNSDPGEYPVIEHFVSARGDHRCGHPHCDRWAKCVFVEASGIKWFCLAHSDEATEER